MCFPLLCSQCEITPCFYSEILYTYSGDSFDCNCINVELGDEMIRELKRGRAAGLDGLMAEHLVFS